jgi:FkbM family methyltransferase
MWRLLWPIDSIENHTFLPPTLGPGSVVVDLGANEGRFAREIARRYGVTCHAAEPNPELFRSLHGDGAFRAHHVAVSGADGPQTLHLSSDVTSSSVASGNVPGPAGEVVVPGMTLASFCREAGVGRIDLLKVDIEGAEVAMFESTPDELLGRIAQITIEFHDDHGLMTRQEFAAIRDRLMGLGFAGIQFAGNNTNWLFFRPDVARVGRLRQRYLRLVVRNVRGVLRKLGFRNN